MEDSKKPKTVQDRLVRGLHAVGKFATAGGGLVGSSWIMQRIPLMNAPMWAQRVVPGLAGIILALIVKSFSKKSGSYADNLATGVGLAGVMDIIKKTIGDKLPAGIASAIPTLSGVGRMGYVQNYGAYPPSYYRDNVQGLGNTAYALQGPGMGRVGNTAYALQGPGMGRVGNTAYALQGMSMMTNGGSRSMGNNMLQGLGAQRMLLGQ